MGQPIRSLPALAAALRRADAGELPDLAAFDSRALAQVYRLGGNGDDLAAEASAAAHVVRHLADRLRRLPQAYGEWAAFDAPAYFDFSAVQSAQIVTIAERVTTVHVAVFADLLLPSFQRAVTAFAAYAAAHARLHGIVEEVERFFDHAQPAMLDAWAAAVATVDQARDQLADDAGYLGLNGAAEERWRWSAAWQQPAAPGVDASLLPAPAGVPTLTLITDFPLPAWRQPGRRRRLYANRARRAHRRSHRRSGS